MTAIVGYLNDTLRPLLSALPDDALSPAVSPVGIEGRTVYADTSDTGPLFFNPLTSLPLRVADSLRMLNGMLTTFQTQLTDMGVSVSSLQSRLASTNQNDIALALRSLQDVANSLQVAQNTQQTTINELQIGSLKRQMAQSATITLTTLGPPPLPPRPPPSPFAPVPPPPKPDCRLPRRLRPPPPPGRARPFFSPICAASQLDWFRCSHVLHRGWRSGAPDMSLAVECSQRVHTRGHRPHPTHIPKRAIHKASQPRQ